MIMGKVVSSVGDAAKDGVYAAILLAPIIVRSDEQDLCSHCTPVASVARAG